MRLVDLISEEVIRPSLAGSSKDAVIDELIDALVAAGHVAPEARESVARAVHQREASHTTGLGSGVAVPHGVSDQVDQVVGALGIHRAGVDFAAVDGQPVHLVILLVVPPNMFQAHIRTLAGVARVLNDPGLRRQLMAATQPEAVMTILAEREGALEPI
ncbi:MAG: PTS sugar transporter subunit IIA [Planctomycetes bacterium]|nr:PTS sugar transporter subunit IIA [Planctomycetota bacterium]